VAHLHLLRDDAQGSHNCLSGSDAHLHRPQRRPGPAGDGERLARLTCNDIVKRFGKTERLSS
jgi:hypothetical protein